MSSRMQCSAMLLLLGCSLAPSTYALWDQQTGIALPHAPGLNMDVAWHPSGDWLALSTWNRTPVLSFWSPDGDSLGTLPRRDPGWAIYALGLTFDRAGRTFAHTERPVLRVHDLETREVWEWEYDSPHHGWPLVVLHPTKPLLATSMSSLEVILFNSRTGTRRAGLGPLRANVMAFHPDGRWLGVIGTDLAGGSLSVWDVAQANLVWRLPYRSSEAETFVWAASGTALITRGAGSRTGVCEGPFVAS